MRHELTPLERGEHFARRKEIYEAKHPETKAGASQASAMNRSLGKNVSETVSPTFAADTAAKTGVSERTIRHEVQIANAIADDVPPGGVIAVPVGNEKLHGSCRNHCARGAQ